MLQIILQHCLYRRFLHYRIAIVMLYVILGCVYGIRRYGGGPLHTFGQGRVYCYLYHFLQLLHYSIAIV
jgi:hypothetical protein